jgi:cytoskeleton protein RodZ
VSGWSNSGFQMPEFGDRFKKARESLGITLEEIAAETKISARFLDAIENERFDALPGGIFSRGFIRSFAQRVGLDPEAAVSEYERLSGTDEFRLTDISGTVHPGSSHPTVNQKLYPIAGAALLLLIIIYYGIRGGSDQVESTSPAQVVNRAPAPSVPATDAGEAPVQERAAEGGPAAPVAKALNLVVEVHQPTWIRLFADGHTLVQGEILEPGSTRRYTAQDSMNLVIGNAAGLTLTINNRQVPSLGDRGEVRALSITPENLNQITGE